MHVAAIAGLILVGAAGGCALESRYYFPRCCDFPTPAGYEDVHFATSDGVDLHGWFLSSPSLAAGLVEQAPVVVFCHGNYATIDVAGPGVAALGRSADVSLLFFSYRGYGRSNECDRVTRACTVMDAQAALSAALARPDVDPSRVAIMGYSIGGVPALAVAADRPEVRAVIIGGTYSHARLILKDRGRSLAYLFVGGEFDPAGSAALLGPRPLFLFHGLADTVIEPYHARIIEAAAVGGRTPVTMDMIEGADHYDILENRPGLFDEMAAFLRASFAEPVAARAGP